MNRVNRVILACAVMAAVVLTASLVFAQTGQQTQQAQQGQQAQQAQMPGQVKWVNPMRGLVEVQYLKPDTKVVKNDVVTVIKVKNVSSGPVARLKVEEYWWDKNNNPVAVNGDWARRPVMPGEIVTFTITTPRDPRMFRNNYKFSHAYGDVKPKLVPKFETPETEAPKK